VEEEMDEISIGATPIEVSVSEVKKWRIEESDDRGRTYESGMKLPRPPTLVIAPSGGSPVDAAVPGVGERELSNKS
jgi:hypothetical protein